MHDSDGGEHAGIDQWEASVYRLTEPWFFPFITSYLFGTLVLCGTDAKRDVADTQRQQVR
jgi:hypothetical protein